MKDYKGFTLIEVIVILAVISILAAMAIPTALRIFQTTATNATTTEMQNVKNAILGDPTKVQNGVRSDFGFLDRKSTRLNSSHLVISYAVFCLKKKNIVSTVSNCTTLYA